MPKNTALITYLVLVHRSKWVQPNMKYQQEMNFCNILLPCNQSLLHTHGIEHPWDPWVRREDRVLRRKRILPFIPKYYRYSKCFYHGSLYIEYNVLPATDFVSSLQFKGTLGKTHCPVPLHLWPLNPHASPQYFPRQALSGKFGLFAMSIII